MAGVIHCFDMNTRVCGLDEAGRGSLAGPLVAAGVVLYVPGSDISSDCGVPLRDSKTLSKNQRERFYNALIASQALVVTLYISVQEINSHGIGWANKEIFRRLIREVTADQYIIDGNLKIEPMPEIQGTVRSVIDADASIDAVICAGIAAKVTRDRYMHQLNKIYPNYGWDRNAGYGTAEHIKRIQSHNISPEHRTTFVNTALKKYPMVIQPAD